MKKFYYSSVTEFEQGWGQRDDGYVVCLDEEKLKSHIKLAGENRNYELFDLYTEIEEIYCSEEDYEKIRKDNNHRDGVMWIKSLKEYKFFKEA